MTAQKNVVIIEAEPISPDDKCELCGAIEETRPYGPNGARICFACGQKDKAATEKRMVHVMFGEPR